MSQPLYYLIRLSPARIVYAVTGEGPGLVFTIIIANDTSPASVGGRGSISKGLVSQWLQNGIMDIRRKHP